MNKLKGVSFTLLGCLCVFVPSEYVYSKSSVHDDDIDALMDKAKKEGDVRIRQANIAALKKIEKSNNDYYSVNVADEINRFVNSTNNKMSQNHSYSNKSIYGYGSNNASNMSYSKTEAMQNLLTRFSTKFDQEKTMSSVGGVGTLNQSSNYKVKTLNEQVVSEIRCSGSYRILDRLLKSYTDPMLVDVRNQILSENFVDMLGRVKAAVSNKEQALQILQKQIDEADNIAATAAKSSSQTWGGPGDDLAKRLNSEQLPLTLNCSTTESMPYKSICAAVINQWSSLASQLSKEVVKKCW